MTSNNNKNVSLDLFSLEALDTQFLEAYQIAMEEFAYEGFDPRYFITNVLGKVETNKPQLRDDMSRILSWYVIRGTKVTGTKVTTTTAEAGYKKIKEVTDKYKVKNVLGEKDRTKITVGRIAACFPHVVAFLMGSPDSRIVGATQANLPRHYHFPGAPSIMTAEVWQVHEASWRLWQKSFATSIKAKPTDSDFGLIAHNSTLFSSEQRALIIKSLKIPG
jgi:hypothetical protein